MLQVHATHVYSDTERPCSFQVMFNDIVEVRVRQMFGINYCAQCVEKQESVGYTKWKTTVCPETAAASNAAKGFLFL